MYPNSCENWPRSVIVHDKNMITESKDKDWAAIVQNLPSNWKDLAYEHKVVSIGNFALTDPDVIMKIMLSYLMTGDSFETVSQRAIAQGLVKHVSEIAVLNKFRKCAALFAQLSQILLKERLTRLDELNDFPWRVRAFDGTHITTKGNKIKDLRLHLCIDVLNGAMDYVDITDIHGGETLQRLPAQKGDLILADRGYGNHAGVQSIIDQDADVIVRINSTGFPLFDESGEKIVLTKAFNHLKEGQCGDISVRFNSKENHIDGRLCVYRKTEEEREKALKKATDTAKRKGNNITNRAKVCAGYVFVFTTLKSNVASASRVLNIYRLRWQVEIYFKKLKQLLKIGRPPSKNKESLDSWIHGKMLSVLLVEGFAGDANPFPP